MSASVQSNFPHEEGISCERAGLFFLSIESFSKSSQCIVQSYHAFRKWGATAKVNHLINKHASILKTQVSTFPFSEINADAQEASVASMSQITAPSLTSL